MTRADRVKEEITRLRFNLGLSAAVYVGVTGWLGEIIVDRRVPDVPGYISLGAIALLVLLVFYFIVIDSMMRKKIEELENLP